MLNMMSLGNNTQESQGCQCGEGFLLCLSVAQSGDEYGMTIAPPEFGAMCPPAFRGVPIHTVTNNATTGLCLARMGVDGETQVAGVTEIDWDIEGYIGNPVTYIWNDIDLRYEVTDLALATHVATFLGDFMGMQPITVTFVPLEAHPSWSRPFGIPSNTSWDDGIVYFHGNSEDASILYEAWDFVDGSVECDFLYIASQGQHRSFPLALRIGDGIEPDFIGVRSRFGDIELHERINGVFNELHTEANPASVPFPVKIEVSGTDIILTIDGVITNHTTALTNGGGAGMVVRDAGVTPVIDSNTLIVVDNDIP